MEEYAQNITYTDGEKYLFCKMRTRLWQKRRVGLIRWMTAAAFHISV